ncbi:MAG: hypothetical protein M0R47_19105 [Methylobacter sp.]|uniref:hypothetical protein n=1 Tax=Methylobacter sp. TaxID=2051955 RepID=UPI0025ED25F0|nr:hypothetical protein [Methylobacter sp.]MCK9622631.1 hypothetical protein [Methylobacter sp.]
MRSTPRARHRDVPSDFQAATGRLLTRAPCLHNPQGCGGSEIAPGNLAAFPPPVEVNARAIAEEQISVHVGTRQEQLPRRRKRKYLAFGG